MTKSSKANFTSLLMHEHIIMQVSFPAVPSLPRTKYSGARSEGRVGRWKLPVSRDAYNSFTAFCHCALVPPERLIKFTRGGVYTARHHAVHGCLQFCKMVKSHAVGNLLCSGAKTNLLPFFHIRSPSGWNMGYTTMTT
jgi:hypothetical protein